MKNKLAWFIGVAFAWSLASTAHSIPFGTDLSENTTGFADSVFTGAPDGGLDFSDVGIDWVGIGGQVVEYDFGLDRVINGSGVDFVIYEVGFGGPEFGSIEVTVSLNGSDFSSILTPMTGVDILGDSGRGDEAFAQGYDIGAFGPARFIRIDGVGTGASGSNNAFDLDAIGLVNFRSVSAPSTVLLLGLGLIGIFCQRRKQRATL